MRGRRGEQPVGKGLAAQALRAGADQDDGAAVLDGVLCVVQRLLRLVQIGVLRCAALADQNDIRFFRNGAAVHPVEVGAARAMRKGHVAGHGIDDLLVLVQNDIDDEVHAADRGGFLQILADGVSVQTAGAGQRRDHEPVIGLDGQRRGNAGHDGLRAAGIAGKIMKLDVAQADPEIGFRDCTGDVHRRSVCGVAQVDAVGRIGVDAADRLIAFPADQTDDLLRRVPAVRAERQHDGDVLRPDARPVQLVQNTGEDLVRGQGTRDIAGDDRDPLAGSGQLMERCRADGVRQRPRDRIRPPAFMLDGGGMEDT